MKRPQNNSTTNPKYTRPTIPNLKKAKERERKQKTKHAPQNNRRRKKERKKAESKNISKKGEK